MIFTLTYILPQDSPPRKSFFTMQGGPLVRDFSEKSWKTFVREQKDFGHFYSNWAEEAQNSPGAKIIRNL